MLLANAIKSSTTNLSGSAYYKYYLPGACQGPASAKAAQDRYRSGVHRLTHDLEFINAEHSNDHKACLHGAVNPDFIDRSDF